MKKLLITLFISSILFSIQAQEAIVYKTYQDFQNNTGVKYDKFLNYLSKFKFEKSGEIYKISYEDLWGFKVGDDLFIMYKSGKHAFPYKVMIIGPKLCYYEDGFPYLEVIHSQSPPKISLGESLSYVSKDIQSELFTIRKSSYDREDKKATADLRKFLSGPEYNSLFECLNGSVYFRVLRECAQKFKQ